MDENNLNEIENNNSKDINRAKLIFYSGKQILLHVTLKSGEFRNCFIKEEESPGIWGIEERKLGKDHLFEDEITRIDKYVPKEIKQ
jgi:hypothetical protein